MVHQQKPKIQKGTIKTMFGWMHYSYSKHKYVQVRATGVETGGIH